MLRLPAMLATVLLLILGTAAQAASVLIARSDGTVPFTSTLYTDGLGTPSDANYIADTIASYDSLGSGAVIRITIGSVEDYFRPVAGNTLLEMLTAFDKHEWSAMATGPFVAPAYGTAGFLGGSATGWPALNVPGDNRDFLPFWGSDNTGSSFLGGCCHTTLDAGGSWGQAFTMEVVAPVPLPAGAWLMLGGLGATAALRRRRRTQAPG